MSIISSGMKITGDLECAGVVKVDGRIDGSVTGARQVLLGRGGAVHGNVIADEVVIGGVVDGAILAAERLELQGTAIVNGDIETKSIIVLEGARINALHPDFTEWAYLGRQIARLESALGAGERDRQDRRDLGGARAVRSL